MSSADGALYVLSRWFPADDDPAAGRFVAVVESVASDVARKAPVEIVALDGHDYVAAVGAVRGGHASMAGGSRRLADTWLSSGLGTLDTMSLANPSRRAT